MYTCSLGRCPFLLSYTQGSLRKTSVAERYHGKNNSNKMLMVEGNYRMKNEYEIQDIKK